MVSEGSGISLEWLLHVAMLEAWSGRARARETETEPEELEAVA